MKPNWFVGLRVPPEAGVTAKVKGPPEGVRLFAEADLHMTVAFLGASGEAAAQRAWDRRLLARASAISASLGAVVPMGPPRRFSALAAELQAGHDAACGLIEALRAPMLEAAGARPDDRPPRPHITVARLRRRAAPGERQGALAWASALELEGLRVELAELVLYTWAEDRTRTLFRAEASERLA